MLTSTVSQVHYYLPEFKRKEKAISSVSQEYWLPETGTSPRRNMTAQQLPQTSFQITNNVREMDLSKRKSKRDSVHTLKPTLGQTLFTKSVRTSKKTQRFAITKTSWATLFREIIAVWSENHTKPTLWAKCRVQRVIHIVTTCFYVHSAFNPETDADKQVLTRLTKVTHGRKSKCKLLMKLCYIRDAE